jgi:hypothetical protein
MSPFEHGEVYVLDDGGEVTTSCSSRSFHVLLIKEKYFSLGVIMEGALMVFSNPPNGQKLQEFILSHSSMFLK